MATRQQKRVDVVTVFLEHDGKILLLRRSQRVRTMKTMWAGISGYIENEDPLMRALKEIEEEAGLSNEKIRASLHRQTFRSY